MAKNISFKEFKIAVKALNGVLKSAGTKTIKVVGVKKEEIIEEFTKTVVGFINDEKTSDLPNTVIDFYNNSIVGDDEDDDQKDGKKKDGKKKDAKKDAKKDKKKTKTKKVGAEIIKAIVENDNCVDREKVLNIVAKVFPDRKKDGMKTTVNHVIGVMKNYFNYLASKK